MIIVCLLLLLPLLLLRRRLRRLRRLYCRRRPRVRRHPRLLYHIPQRHGAPQHGDLGFADRGQKGSAGAPKGLQFRAIIPMGNRLLQFKIIISKTIRRPIAGRAC